MSAASRLVSTGNGQNIHVTGRLRRSAHHGIVAMHGSE